MKTDEILSQMATEVTEASSLLDQFLDTIVKEQATIHPILRYQLGCTLALIETNMAANADNFHIHLTTIERQACALLDDAYLIQTTILKKLLQFPPTP